MNDNFIIHKNETSFGYVWHIVYKPGIGLVSVELDNDNVFTVYGLSVIESERNKGIGKSLLAKVEEIAKENNVTLINVNIEKEHKELVDYYKKLGYNIDYVNYESEYYYMSKSLNNF